MMRVGDDEHKYAEHMRRAVLMMHAPALLHELKAAFDLLLQVLDLRARFAGPFCNGIGHRFDVPIG
jgi:hypothetical protein